MWEALGVASGAPAIANANIPAAEQIEPLATPVNTALNPPMSTFGSRPSAAADFGGETPQFCDRRGDGDRD